MAFTVDTEWMEVNRLFMADFCYICCESAQAKQLFIDRLHCRSLSQRSRHTWQYKLLYKTMAKSMGRGKFWPPTSRKPLDWFWWNSKYITIIRRPPQMQNKISIGWRGWSGRIPSLPLSGFFVCLSFCMVRYACVQVTLVDQLWRSMRHHMTSFQAKMQLFGVWLI